IESSLPAIGDEFGFFLGIRDRGQPDGPMVLHRIDSGLGRGKHIHAMRNRGKAEAVRFIDNRLEGLASKRLADFDLIESHLLLPSHHLAAFFRTLDRKGAPTATAPRRRIRSLPNAFAGTPRPC